MHLSKAAPCIDLSRILPDNAASGLGAFGSSTVLWKFNPYSQPHMDRSHRMLRQATLAALSAKTGACTAASHAIGAHPLVAMLHDCILAHCCVSALRHPISQGQETNLIKAGFSSLGGSSSYLPHFIKSAWGQLRAGLRTDTSISPIICEGLYSDSAHAEWFVVLYSGLLALIGHKQASL